VRSSHLKAPTEEIELAVEGLTEHYLPRRWLIDIVGGRFDAGAHIVVPLPHPSGASRWLNRPANRELLRKALTHVRSIWDDHSE
jgi:hypothetical protein